MNELHWTGAAVLLALALLGGEGARPRRAKILSWADFAREHNLDADAQQVPDELPSLAPMRVTSGGQPGARMRRAS
jgi:hypothetical protein